MNQHQLDERKVHLKMTFRYARMALALFKRERKRAQKQHARNAFVPEPGKFDANLMRVQAMDDLIEQLALEIDAANRKGN